MAGRYDDLPFDDLQSIAHEVSDFLDKPDINDYLVNYESEWLDTWEHAPVEDMTPGQIDAFIDMVNDSDLSWEELWDELEDDFWDWFNESYGSSE